MTKKITKAFVNLVNEIADSSLIQGRNRGVVARQYRGPSSAPMHGVQGSRVS
jgi:hypothetical protein